MGFAEFERRKDEKINGVIYDMSPAPGYQHGIINGNIYTVIKQGLKKVYALFLWKIWILGIIRKKMMIMCALI